MQFWRENRLVNLAREAADRPKIELEDELKKGSPEAQNAKIKREAAERADRKSKEQTTDLQVQIRHALERGNNKYLTSEVHNRYLSDLDRHRDPEKLQEILDQINSRKANFASWQKQIGNLKEDIFAQDQTLGTTKEQHAEKFKAKTPEEQAEILKNLDQLIKNYTAQFDQLYEIFGKRKDVPTEILEEFRANGREKRTNFLDELRRTKRDFDRLSRLEGWEQLNKKEQAREAELFNTLDLAGRRLRLKQLEERLTPSKENKDFQLLTELDQKYKLQLLEDTNNFMSMEQKQKIETIKTIKQRLIKKIEASYEPYLDNCNAKMRKGISNLHRQNILDLTYWYSATADNIKTLEETAKYLEKHDFSKSTLDHFRWEELHQFEIKRLVASKDMERFEDKEHQDRIKKYDNKLKKYREYKGFGLLNDEGVKAYQEWFNKLSLEEKDQILKRPEKDYLEQTMAERKKNVDQFTSLPQAIQDDMGNQFLKADFEERRRIIAEIMPKYEKEKGKFIAKIDKMTEADLLAPNSAEEYKQWATTELTLKEMVRYYENSHLDKPQREEYLKLWQQMMETSNFKELPAGKQKALKKQFLESDLEDRYTMLKEEGPDLLDDEDSGINTEELLRQIAIKGEIKVDALDEIDAKIEEEEQRAKLEEKKGRPDLARHHYEQALDLTDREKYPREAKALQQKIQDMEELEELYWPDEKESPLKSAIDEEIYDVLDSGALDDGLTYQTILWLAYWTTKQSEIQTQSTKVEDRMRLSIENEQDAIQELDADLAESESEDRINRDHEGKLSLSSGIAFQAEHFHDESHENYDTDLVYRFAEIQQKPPDQQKANDIQLTNQQGQPLTADQFYTQEVATHENKLQQQLLDQICHSFADKFPPSQPQLHKSFRQLTLTRIQALPESTFRTKLEKRS